jgi:large subunit ribosomal protein L5
VAAFKLREGQPIGVMVTLRSRKMYEFLEKMIRIVFPRVRDFRGVSLNSFDGKGNYSLGFREQIVFPEIEYSKIDKIRGLEVTIVTSGRSDEKGRALLKALGMPFEKK